MPTCRFKPCLTIPKGHGKQLLPKLSFYKAEHWDGPKGYWRVMAGKKWVKREEDERFSFFTIEGVSQFIMEHIGKGLGESTPEPEVSPQVEPHTPVIYVPDDLEEPTIRTRIRTYPTRNSCGEYMVRLFYVPKPVPLRTLRYRSNP